MEPCNAVFSQAERFPTHRDDNTMTGPGSYEVKDNHPEWRVTESVLTVKPAGVGITLTLRENHASHSQSSDREKGQFDIVVKAILKGGAVEARREIRKKKQVEALEFLSVNDVILKIDGEVVAVSYTHLTLPTKRIV